jgi:hypothetical protein
VVHDVGAPVQELPAAAFQDGLPVIAATISLAAQLDFVNLAEQPAVDDFADVLKGRFKTPIVADEEGIRILGGDLG